MTEPTSPSLHEVLVRGIDKCAVVSPALTYADVVAMYDRMANWQAPEPVKLTREQWERLKKDTPTVADPTGTVPLLGVPLHIVETVEESTPYLKGWAGWCVVWQLVHGTPHRED